MSRPWWSFFRERRGNDRILWNYFPYDLLNNGVRRLRNGLAVVYQLESIDADDGVDVFEIAPVLMHFGELVRSANSVLGGQQRIDVRVRPFKMGSWLTEFVLESSTDLLNYFKSDSGQDILLILTLLGLNAKEGVKGVAQVIRFVNGRIASFKRSGPMITYTNEKGEEITVSESVHNLVQSPLVQHNYYNCVITPLEKFPAATAVVIGADAEGSQKQKFTLDDREAFREYAQSELLGEVEENASKLSSVFIKPKRGSYSGQEQQYSFIMGDSVLWPVTIEDADFLQKLQSGDVRLYAEDVVRADIEMRQKRDASNKVSASYTITKVIDYIKYEKPKQLKMDDIESK